MIGGESYERIGIPDRTIDTTCGDRIRQDRSGDQEPRLERSGRPPHHPVAGANAHDSTDASKSAATVSEIGEELAVALPTASEVLRVLEQRGLIKKQRSKTDARTVMVSLTTKGRRKADVAAGWPDFLAAAAEVLPPTEQESLLRALIKMIRTLQEQGDIPIAKMCITCRFFHPNVHEEKERPHHCELVDAAFGDRLLRIECAEHQVAEKKERDQTWERFMNGT